MVHCWGDSGPSWVPLGSFLDPLGALLGRLGTLLGASWAVSGLSWRPLRPSRAVGNPNRREPQNLSKTLGHRCFCLPGLSGRASWSSLGSLLGSLGASWCLLGRLGGLLARLTPSEAVLGASLGRRSAFWKRFRLVLGSSWQSLGRSWDPLGPICGRLGSLMGCLGAILEASRAVLGGRTPQQAENLKIFQKL